MKFVLLPAYNEEKNIVAVIREAKKYVKGKIIVVDDGSIDDTSKLAKKCGATVLKHETNMGKGAAINTGFKYILKIGNTSTIVLIADADRQYSLKEAKKLIGKIESGEADIVTGYRVPSQIPFANRVGNFIWKKIFNFFFKTNFIDTNCGYSSFTLHAIRKIMPIHGGYIIENSILSKAIKNKLRVEQVPVTVVYRKRKIAKSAKMFFGVLFFILKEGLKYRLQYM